jgi:release factor glutamine methyltransferase
LALTIDAAIALGRQQLAGLDSAETDVSVMLCHVLQCSATLLHMSPETLLSAEQAEQFEDFLAQRRSGTPVAYITGQRGFWSLDLAVNSSTLIPRPDTETLVETALQRISADARVADLGTGSGAIALSLATECPAAQIIAVDKSQEALAVAKSNAIKHQLSNVDFICGSWLNAFAADSFDVIVSNPPYIRDTDPHLQQGDLRFEPLTALASGVDGLDDIRLISQQALTCLKPGGWLLIEHGYDQSAAVQQLLREAGYVAVMAYQDFGGQARVVEAQLPL